MTGSELLELDVIRQQLPREPTAAPEIARRCGKNRDDTILALPNLRLDVRKALPLRIGVERRNHRNCKDRFSLILDLKARRISRLELNGVLRSFHAARRGECVLSKACERRGNGKTHRQRPQIAELYKMHGDTKTGSILAC